MNGPAAASTSLRGLSLTLLALLTLAGISLVLRFAHLGVLGYVAGLGIAAAKAVLVVVFFMELGAERPSARFAFATCLALVGLMLAFILADVVTRSSPPMRAPPGTADRDRG